MLKSNKNNIYLIASLMLMTACGGSDTYQPDAGQDARPWPSASKSLASATKRPSSSSQHSKKTASKKSENDNKKELREIRSREISALRNDIDEKREEIRLKHQVRTSLLSQKTQIDTSEIDSHSTAQNPTASMVGAVSASGGSSSSWIGPVLGGAGVAAAAISDRNNEQKQQATVNAARQGLMRKISSVDSEIKQLEQELKALEDELEKLIDPQGLVEDA